MILLDRNPSPAQTRGWLSSRLRADRRRTPGAIGLELSYERLHMVQMDLGGDGPSIRAATSLEYPVPRDELMTDAGALKRLVKKGLASQPFSGRRVVTTMPTGAVKLMLVTYSVPDDASEPQVVLQRSLERLDGDAADWVVDYLPVQSRRDREGDRAALVACTRRDDVVAYLDHLSRAGLEVQAVEVGPVAVRRLIASLTEANAMENVLTINFGRAKSYLTVYTAGTIALDREVNFGEDELASKVAASLEMSLGEATELLYRYGVGRVGAAEVSGLPDEIASTITQIVRNRFLGPGGGGREGDDVHRIAASRGPALTGCTCSAAWPVGPARRLCSRSSWRFRWRFSIPSLHSSHAVTPRCSKNLDPIAGIALATGCALRGGEAP